MAKPGKGAAIGYAVVAVLMALMMLASASAKLTHQPRVVHQIHEVVGVPLTLFPVLATLEIVGGLGLLAGIWRATLGVAGAAGLMLYFTGAIVAHVLVRDWSGLKAPVVPFVLALACFALAVAIVRRTSPPRASGGGP